MELGPVLKKELVTSAKCISTTLKKKDLYKHSTDIRKCKVMMQN